MKTLFVIVLGMLLTPVLVQYWKVIYHRWYLLRAELHKEWYRIRFRWMTIYRAIWILVYKGFQLYVKKHRKMPDGYEKVLNRWVDRRLNVMFQTTLKKVKKIKLDCEYKLKEWH